jgi:hypothetical protein
MSPIISFSGGSSSSTVFYSEWRNHKSIPCIKNPEYLIEKSFEGEMKKWCLRKQRTFGFFDFDLFYRRSSALSKYIQR